MTAFCTLSNLDGHEQQQEDNDTGHAADHGNGHSQVLWRVGSGALMSWHR